MAISKEAREARRAARYTTGRNAAIYAEYLRGDTLKQIAKRHHLHPTSIWGIVQRCQSYDQSK